MGILNTRLSRRDLIKLAAGGAGFTIVTACTGQTAPAPTATTAAVTPAAGASQSPSAGNTPTPQATVKRGGTFRYLVQNDFMSLLPALTTGPTAWGCHNFLVYWRRDDKGKWGPQPGLAESWELSGTKAIFKIRQGVKFHDGSDLDAEAVRFNFEVWKKHPRSGARETIESVDDDNPAQVLDKYTVQVNLKAPAGSLLAEISSAATNNTTGIFSKAAYEKLGDKAMERQPVGTGPFQFVKWESGNQLVLKRFDDYWEKGEDGKPLPYIDEVIYRFVPDDSVRLMEMRTGNADFMELVPGKDVPTVKGDSNLVYNQSDFMGNTYRFMFNATKPPFKDNLKLRQAVQYAIDRESIAKALGMGLGQPLKYELTPGGVGYDESVPYYWYDPAKAKELVKEAGYPDGLSITITAISRDIDLQMSEMIKQQLEDVGIKVTIEAMERVAWGKKVREGADYQMGTQRTGLSVDPDRRISLYWLSTGNAAYIRADLPELAAAAAEARSSYDTAVRHQAYIKCQKLMYQSAWWGYVWLQTYNNLVSRRVTGFRMNQIWDRFIEEHRIWFNA